MKSIITLSIIFFCLISCGKEDSQFSHWTVDGQEYSSNNVTVSIGKAIANLDCWDENRFDITFYSFSVGHLNSLPDAGDFLLSRDNIEQDPSKVLLYIYFDTTTYAPSTSEVKYLRAERVNGKVRYTLPKMWYINYNNPDDSVEVEGTFNEP